MRNDGQDSMVVQLEQLDAGCAALSPAIGWWEHGPTEGQVLGAGAVLGTLVTGSRRRTIVIPDGPAWRVRLAHPPGRRAVAYGELLLRLEGLEQDTGTDTRAAHGGAQNEAGATLAVVSPTDGVFFRRPSPDAAPFVEPGARVQRGQPVGLVEVMKTFNQVLYGAAGLPDEAEVVELVAADGEEVAAGQPLVVVRPI